jgi:hypothetical protein
MNAQTNPFSPQTWQRDTARTRISEVVGFPFNPVRVTLSEPQVTWADEVRARLNHVCSLPVGWDGYHGRPTRFDAAEFALRLLQRVCKPHTPAPFIVPLPCGGLQIEWHEKSAIIELGIRAPMEVDAFVADPSLSDDGEERSLTVDFSFILPWVHKLGGSIENKSAA